MATYPDGIVEFREIENLPGIAFDEADKTTVFAEDIQKVDAEVVAIEETIGANPTGPFTTVAEFLSEMSDQIQEQFETINDLTALVNTLRLPVGSIYTNADDSTNPATLLGYGTWTAFGQGRVLVGKASSGTFDTAGATGGAENHRHKIKLHHSAWWGAGIADGNNMFYVEDDDGQHASVAGRNIPNATKTRNNGLVTAQTTFSDNYAGTVEANTYRGTGTSLQPYVVVYMWKRTA